MRFDLELLDFVDSEVDFDKLALSASDKDLTWNEFKNEVEKLKIEISILKTKVEQLSEYKILAETTFKTLSKEGN